MVNTKVLAMNMEPVQVGIAPADCDLKRIVEIGHRAVATNKQTSPDHGANLLEPHL